jgi:3-hydroxyisobutyrate dehydrogenase-like beta-hydroxyacid dehydrogenase
LGKADQVPQKDVILTSLPRAPHVKEVYLNPNTGLLAANKKSHDAKLFLEMSTIDTAASKEVGQTVAASGLGEFFDAPCSVSHAPERHRMMGS